MLLTLVLFPLALLPIAHGSQVIVFGDSWAEGAADELQEALYSAGHGDVEVVPLGVGGTTADYWANTEPGALPAAAQAYADADWVWLSIGGNDLFAHHLAGQGASNAADYDRNLRAMLAGLYGVRPDVEVVMFGYDFINFEQSNDCILTAWTYFGTAITTPQVNQYFIDDVMGTIGAVAGDTPRLTYVDSVLGTLQRAGGVQGAPNPLLPSPSRYMADCIHPNHEGYGLIMDALVADFWGLTEPSVSLSVDAQVCVEHPVEAVAGGSADTWRWFLDGDYQGQGGSQTLQFSEPGVHTLTLEGQRGAWRGAQEQSIEAVAELQATLAGSAQATAGVESVFAAAGESPQWEIEGGAVTLSDDGREARVIWDAPGVFTVSVTTLERGCAASAVLEVTVEEASSGQDSGGGSDSAPSVDSGQTGGGDKGCSSAPGGSWGLWLLGVLLLRRRTQRPSP